MNTNKDILEIQKGSTSTAITTREIEQKEVSTTEYIKPPSSLIRNFTRFYIEQGFQNGAEAARKAGSQAKNPNQVAFQWLQDPWVEREIETAKELISQGKNPLDLITQDDVVNKLLAVYTMALADKKYDPALKAIELMGKHLGMFIVGPSSTKTLTLRETQTLQLTQDADSLSHLSQVLKDSSPRQVVTIEPTVEDTIEDSST